MADENQRTTQVPKENRISKHIPIFFKVIEIILAIFAIGLLVDPLNSFQRVFNKPRFKLDDAAFIYVTVAGYIMINSLFIICHLLGDRLPKRTEQEIPYDEDFENVPMVKPIRIVQFILLASLIALTIYTCFNKSPYTEIDKILLFLAFGTFLFITFIDIISQLGGDPITETPMFLFGVVGAVIILLAAFQIFSVTRREEVNDTWKLMTAIVLSVIASIVYLIDVLLIFLYGY
uniref:Uncharacterized protein n=1 Tax=Vespula pensylvanica TaxID=30213 RepID=A0A834P553_VESPE|nr:hypothetical protein H0235_005625 [Vespula pensylvanica]